MPETQYQSARQAINSIAGKLTPLVVMLALWLAQPGPAAAADNTTRTGVVGRVVDGDTVWLKVRRGAQPVKVRIQGIDAPEICQPGGVESRNMLKRRLAGRSVVLSVHGHDDHGRVLAAVALDGEDVGEWMVSNGQAWSYRYRGSEGPYIRQESAARAARRGIFAGASAENPRSFRDRHGSCYPPRSKR